MNRLILLALIRKAVVESVAVPSTLSLLTRLQALGSFAFFFPFADNISKSVMMLGSG